jgi:hypothetical protein
VPKSRFDPGLFSSGALFWALLKFKNERDEREFWDYARHHGLLRFFRVETCRNEFDPGIEAPVKSISLRLPRQMLNQLKVLANKKDIPYQSLIKVYLAEKIAEERKAG